MVNLIIRVLAFYFYACLIFFMHGTYAKQNASTAITQPIPINDIQEYGNYPVNVRELIAIALPLSQKKLTYLYGSADPKNNGMDCSGTIYYLLNNVKIHDAPRQANEMFSWVEKEGKLYRVTQQNFDSPQFANLKPGDLLFWSGTYAIHRNPPITHVMIYLGKNTKNEPLMFGASDGRTYQGKKMRGVSVFDFKLPKEVSYAKFAGYSCVPHLTC